MTALLDVEGLTAGFGANQVLHGIDLTLAPGTSGVLLGLNGAGKSVTLKTISGLVEAWEGSIRLAGVELSGLETEDRVRAGVGHVLQTKAVFPELSVAENLRLGGAVVGRRRRRPAVAGRARRRWSEHLDSVYSLYPRLADRAGQLAGRLSGGEQAMLAVGRALMAQPTLLLVDEPSAGLSPRMVSELVGTLRQVRTGGTALLVVEQNVGFALDLADEVFVLEKGRVVYRGPAMDLDRNRIASLLGMGDLLGAVAAPPTPDVANGRAPTKRAASSRTRRRSGTNDEAPTKRAVRSRATTKPATAAATNGTPLARTRRRAADAGGDTPAPGGDMPTSGGNDEASSR